MRRHLAICLLAAATWFGLPATPVAAQGLSIAAASDLQGVLPQVASLYERQTGQPARVTFGSSGNFFSQIQNGAPFDVFMSADIDYPRQLEKAGLTEPGTLYEYATGQIVLWTLKTSGLDLKDGLQALLSPSVRRISIANPEHAPYGRAAVAALRSAGIYDRVQPKLVMGENISQAAQFVQSGNADVGIVAHSIALMPGAAERGVSAPIPAGSYPAIEQAAIVIRTSRDKDSARRFLAFLKTPAVVSLMQQFGFEIPAAAGQP
jgi:molybdate transport system substrate-binding protein